MSKDDIETNTMNVMFDGSDDNDKDDDDGNNWKIYSRRNTTER
jgi:hypothetical protein